ncbi:MAG TPA: aspartyl protease family protein [Blastocatellia bacterium]|nr:aspartyl protease family protein [Blastocatellia bacterium]
MNHQLAFLLRLNYQPDGPGIRLPIKLTTGNQEIPLEAYPDTGAPRSVFPRWVGEELGIEIEAGGRQVLSTGGGPMEVYEHRSH